MYTYSYSFISRYMVFNLPDSSWFNLPLRPCAVSRGAETRASNPLPVPRIMSPSGNLAVAPKKNFGQCRVGHPTEGKVIGRSESQGKSILIKMD